MKWKFGDKVKILNHEQLFHGDSLKAKKLYRVVDVFCNNTPMVINDHGDLITFSDDEVKHIERIKTKKKKKLVKKDRLIEILTNVSEQQAEELLFKEKRNKLLEEELLATKTRLLQLATQFDVTSFKDEQ